MQYKFHSFFPRFFFLIETYFLSTQALKEFLCAKPSFLKKSHMKCERVIRTELDWMERLLRALPQVPFLCLASYIFLGTCAASLSDGSVLFFSSKDFVPRFFRLPCTKHKGSLVVNAQLVSCRRIAWMSHISSSRWRQAWPAVHKGSKIFLQCLDLIFGSTYVQQKKTKKRQSRANIYIAKGILKRWHPHH